MNLATPVVFFFIVFPVYGSVLSWTWQWSRLRGHSVPVSVALTMMATGVAFYVFAAWLLWSVAGRQKGPLARARDGTRPLTASLP